MAQPGGTMNFLIHDANGQTQMIKVATNRQGQVIRTNRTLSTEGTPAVVTESTGSQMLRTISLQSTKTGQRHQLVTLPMIKTMSPNTSPSSVGSQGNSVFIKEEYMDEVGDEGEEEEEEHVEEGGGGETPQYLQDTSMSPQHQSTTSSTHLMSAASVATTPRYVASPFMNVADSPNVIKYTPPTASAKKRASTGGEGESGSGYKRSRGEKASKGLRHFSMKVCEKVRRKGVTTYNEVADELVQEFSETQNNVSSEQYDQKNIRRRVYDALNVLMAMNIISKEKKEIKWLGLPTNSLQESLNLNKERKQLIQRINQKTKHLHDLLLQQISLKKLIQKNVDNEKMYGEPAPSSAIQLPFLIVSTDKKTVIDCSMSNDKTEYLFVFNDKFEIHDDIEILNRMGLNMGLDKGFWTEEDLIEARRLVAPCMEKYVNQIAYRDGFLAEEADDTLEDETGSFDNSQITIETVMPEEVLSVSGGSEVDSDLSSDIDQIAM